MRIALSSPFLLLRELTLKPADRPGSLVMGSALLFKEQSSEGLRSGSGSRQVSSTHHEGWKPQMSE